MARDRICFVTERTKKKRTNEVVSTENTIILLKRKSCGENESVENANQSSLPLYL